MDKLEPRNKEPEIRIIYQHSWPAVRGTINGNFHSNSRISIELRVINGKMKDVIINGAPFVLDVKNHHPAKKASGGKHG